VAAYLLQVVRLFGRVSSALGRREAEKGPKPCSIDSEALGRNGFQFKSARAQETFERLESGRGLALLDSRNRSLSYSGSSAELALAEACFGSGVSK